MASDESTKGGLHLIIKKTKIMTIEETHNFNMNSEDTEIVIDFAYHGSVVNANGECCQEIKRRLRLGRAITEELGKIKSKDVSQETKAKITHIFTFPISMYTMYGCKSSTAKKADT